MVPSCYSRRMVMIRLVMMMMTGVMVVSARRVQEEITVLHSAKDPIENATFMQSLDHPKSRGSTTTTTFQQQYFVNRRYYRAGGPGFLVVGGESPFNPNQVGGSGIIQDLAQLTGGVIYGLEHRYYGKSIPFPEEKLHPDNLVHLTVDLAIQDIKQFLTAEGGVIKEEIGKKKKGSGGGWILVGGSYAGSLAVWTKQKYPDLITGVIASSAPLEAKPGIPEFDHRVGELLDPTCHLAINQLITAMDKGYKTHDRTLIDLWQSQMSPTATADNNNTKITNSTNSISDPRAEDLEHMFDFSLVLASAAINYPELPSPVAPALCKVVTANHTNPSNGTAEASSIKARLRALVAWTKGYKDTLSALILPPPSSSREGPEKDSSDVGVDEAEAEEDRSLVAWSYQQCTELGWFQTAATPHAAAMRSKFLDLNWFLNKYCGPELFGKRIGPPDTQRINRVHGGKQRVKLDRMIFVNGLNDPWIQLSVDRPQGVSKGQGDKNGGGVYPLANHSALVLIEGGTHTRDLNPYMAIDPAPLKQARTQIKAMVTSWLGISPTNTNM